MRQANAVSESGPRPEVVSRPPLPPFTRETAIQKVRLAEDAWNSRDPERVSLAYTIDSRWRNRAEFVNGRKEIVAFLTRKWSRELDYRLIRNSGRLKAIASQSGLRTNATMLPEVGSARTETKIGTSMSTGSCD